MWKESNRNIVVIFQPNILRIVGFYVRHSAYVFWKKASDQTAASQDSSLNFLKRLWDFFRNMPVSDIFVYFHKKYNFHLVLINNIRERP